MKETETELRLLIRTLYAGSLILTAGLCFQLYLCVQGLHRFRRLPNAKKTSRKAYIYIQLLVLGSTCLVFVIDCLDRGNIFSTFVVTPSHEEAELAPDPVWWAVVTVVAVGFIHLLGDALLAWRCYIVWSHNRVVGLLPVLPWVTSLATGIAYLAAVTRAASQTPDSNALYIKLQAAYFFLSSGVNITATALICLRLARMDSKMRKLSEDATYLQSAASYSRISLILIESALPFTVFGLAAAAISQVLVVKHVDAGASSAYHIIWPLWVISCGLAPQLIIFRVVTGSSWVSNPAAQAPHGTHLQSIRFTPRRFDSSVTTESPGETRSAKSSQAHQYNIGLEAARSE
ncbi:hypothetical protein BKA70DRAFT_1427886 [Coprinopsis sp. MPI-PUGE-AT-0042]|nr:hypothetical protein BKA70DRAFT_1427886 [Coprinopsis sp. MPI-PUGE-AT-0042]